MHEKTATQTYVDLRSLSDDRPRRIGVIIAFSEFFESTGGHLITGRRRLGRDAAMDLVVADPKVSRHHADIELAERGVVVRDAGSHNGTFIDGARVDSGPTGTLAPIGSTIRVGKSLLRVIDDVDAFANYPPPPQEPLIGGPGLARVRRQIEVVARTNAPVLVHGETGTGKERAAQALHQGSGRTGEFVAVNCAAIPRELVESELFGHSKGAFSGSQRARQGLFRTAEGGTLLLDEIGELPLPLQAKLLRVVEDGEVRPVGEDQPMHVDVRIVAATNRHLQTMVDAGTFRADLMHRLAAMTVVLPPLRDRVEDIPLLARYFLSGRLPLTASTMELLLAWHWPGNVRELRNAVLAAHNSCLANGGEQIQVEDLPSHLGGAPRPSVAAPPEVVSNNPDDLLRMRIQTALELRKGNVAQVARDLKMRRPGLYEAFARLSIDPARYRKG